MGDPMTYEDIVSLLGYAGGHEQAVRITTTDRTEVVGIPTSVDTHVTAAETARPPIRTRNRWFIWNPPFT